MKIKGYHQEDIVRLNTNSNEHAKWVLEKIDYDDLAILTWHFDASSQLPSQQLFHYYRSYLAFEISLSSWTRLATSMSIQPCMSI